MAPLATTNSFLITKRCTKCSVVKPTTDYVKNASKPDGLSSTCRTCDAAYAAKRRAQKRAGMPTSTSVTLTGTGPGLPPVTIPGDAPVDDGHALAKRKPVKPTHRFADYVAPRDLLATWAADQLAVRDGEPASNFLFIGPSGCGKTEGAMYLADLANLPVLKVDAPAMTDPEVWFGTREVVVEDGAPKTVVHDSEFVIALARRGLIIIDEFNRVTDAIRAIILALTDTSRAVTNPLTGERVVRHPECVLVMTANVGLAFTGTYAIDPAFLTRSLTTTFDYLGTDAEMRLAMARTGCDEATAALFTRFAGEARTRAKAEEDFAPISTREVLKACGLVARGLDVWAAARQTIINAAPSDGGAQSQQGKLEMIWSGIAPKK